MKCPTPPLPQETNHFCSKYTVAGKRKQNINIINWGENPLSFHHVVYFLWKIMHLCFFPPGQFLGLLYFMDKPDFTYCLWKTSKKLLSMWECFGFLILTLTGEIRLFSSVQVWGGVQALLQWSELAAALDWVSDNVHQHLHRFTVSHVTFCRAFTLRGTGMRSRLFLHRLQNKSLKCPHYICLYLYFYSYY